MNSCHALAKNEGTYTILSKIPTLTELSLRGCDMESLPEGAPCILPSLSNLLLSEGIGQLESLRELSLSCCHQLRALPEGIPPRILPLSAALAILN